MTPEQKAKEIVEKYRKITYKDEYGNDNYERLSKCAAKGCAIEEVKAVIDVIADLHIIADSEGIMKSIIYHEKVLAEIEKL